MSAPRMFRVIVLGGVALVDCGARTDLGRHTDIEDAAQPIQDAADEDAPFTFPEETALSVDSSTPTTDAADEFHFPAEANAPIPDSGTP